MNAAGSGDDFIAQVLIRVNGAMPRIGAVRVELRGDVIWRLADGWIAETRFIHGEGRVVMRRSVGGQHRMHEIRVVAPTGSEGAEGSEGESGGVWGPDDVTEVVNDVIGSIRTKVNGPGGLVTGYNGSRF